MIEDVVVTIPAADEEDEIAGCLHSVERAIAELHERTAMRGHVVVALDDCRDGTADIVATFPHVVSVTCAARRVGGARRRAAAAALDRWGPPERVWLASTDADCRVPVDWLTSMLALSERGMDVVLGTVCPMAGLPAGVERDWYSAHSFGEGHAHIHGANIGISGAAYLRVGGWADAAAHEDVHLVQRAMAADVAIARSGATPVATSSRLTGRAPDGFAAFLRRLHGDLPAVS